MTFDTALEQSLVTFDAVILIVEYLKMYLAIERVVSFHCKVLAPHEVTSGEFLSA